jgi:hypothetical protein
MGGHDTVIRKGFSITAGILDTMAGEPHRDEICQRTASIVPGFLNAAGKTGNLLFKVVGSSIAAGHTKILESGSEVGVIGGG